MCLSIIIPTWNEAEGIGSLLEGLQAWRRKGHELILADGGSLDGTPAAAAGLADRILEAPRGRALQMNAGADAARGTVLLFLHADTVLPEAADEAVMDGLARTGRHWGRFDVRLSGSGPLFRIIERLMNLRSRVTGICTGDQAIFVRAKTFRTVGGFSEMPLMEDIDLSKRLKAFGGPLCLAGPAETSSRRWEENGPLRTVLIMWLLRLAYFLGAPPEGLARIYAHGFASSREG